MLETAEKAKSAGLKTAMITNGFINPKPLEMLVPYIDAFNVDLKSFEPEFYRKITFSALNPVLENIKYLADNKKHVEITNLVIPDLNDDETEFEQMTAWISENTGRETPFHISKYFPNYKLTKPPTSEAKLSRLQKIAQKYLDYVYLGNSKSETGQNTFCPNCGTLVVERKGYEIGIKNINNNNLCGNCGQRIAILTQAIE
jgi:pyruvate formate lyase activating enzyme